MILLWRHTACLWLLVSLVSACSTMPRKEAIAVENTPHVIYLVYTGWHSSIVIEAETLLPHSPQLALDFQGLRAIRVGWGDGDYFTGKSKHWTTATKALLASDYSALQALGYRRDPLLSIPAETRVPLAVSDAGLQLLAQYIERSIAFDSAGLPEHLPPSEPNKNLFYRASPRYSLVNNCNTWSSQALREAGLPMVGGLRLTAKGVFKQAQSISSYQREQGVFD